MLNVSLFLGEKILLESKYIYMEPYAINTSRKFVFKDSTFHENIENLYGDNVLVNITVATKYNPKKFLYCFNVHIFDNLMTNHQEWWLSGIINEHYNIEYKQNVINVFNLWQQEENINWFSENVSSLFKSDYIRSCLIYSGTSKKMKAKDIYKIDMSIIKEEQDFYYLISKEFVGDRGYFGFSLHTFNDCLSQLFYAKVDLHHKRILFYNVDKIHNEYIHEFFSEIKLILIAYDFLLEIE